MNIIDRTTEYQNAKVIERRETQLWLLAMVVIVLLALALFIIDMVNTSGIWWVSPQIKLALNTRTMRACLLLTAFAICAYFRDSVRRLRRENTELIDRLAENGRLLEHKNHEISQLKELSDQLIGETNLQRALDLLLAMAADITGADIASIMLRERWTDELHVVASYGLQSDVVKSSKVKMGECLAGLVVEEGHAMILNSDELTGEFAARALRKDSIVSSIIVPIQIDNDIRGVISTAKRRGGERFTDHDLSVLSTLANQTLLVVQKIELLNDLKDQVSMLAATVEELRHTQDELIQAEKLASIGQLAGGVAHEINNPLQVIRGHIELLIVCETCVDKREDLSLVLENVIRISETVKGLLSFSRQSTNAEFSRVDLNDVLNRTLNFLAPQMSTDNIKVGRNFGDSQLAVDGNANQLQQVFTNIVLNAYHSMRSHGGILTIEGRNTDGMVEVSISDTGSGIPQVILEHIFEPFFTTKGEGEGTGLGLSVVYGIVQSHNGSVRAENKTEGGACFTVSLPDISSATES